MSPFDDSILLYAPERRDRQIDLNSAKRRPRSSYCGMLALISIFSLRLPESSHQQGRHPTARYRKKLSFSASLISYILNKNIDINPRRFRQNF